MLNLTYPMMKILNNMIVEKLADQSPNGPSPCVKKGIFSAVRTISIAIDHHEDVAKLFDLVLLALGI